MALWDGSGEMSTVNLVWEGQDSTALSGASLSVNPWGVLAGTTHSMAFWFIFFPIQSTVGQVSCSSQLMGRPIEQLTDGEMFLPLQWAQVSQSCRWGWGREIWWLGSVSSCGGSHHPCSAIIQLGNLGRCSQGSWEKQVWLALGRSLYFPVSQVAAENFWFWFRLCIPCDCKHLGTAGGWTHRAKSPIPMAKPKLVRGKSCIKPFCLSKHTYSLLISFLSKKT